jgi:hypothetical protein
MNAPVWILVRKSLLCVVSLLIVGCQTRRLGLPEADAKYLNSKSDSSEYLALTANLTARYAMGAVAGAKSPNALYLHLHDTAFLHWLRYKYGPGDTKASVRYLAWYRDSCSGRVKIQIGTLDSYNDPLGLLRRDASGIVLEENTFQFPDPARDQDQRQVFSSIQRYNELVAEFLADIYPR